jgi:hypothetical protein
MRYDQPIQRTAKARFIKDSVLPGGGVLPGQPNTRGVVPSPSCVLSPNSSRVLGPPFTSRFSCSLTAPFIASENRCHESTLGKG